MAGNLEALVLVVEDNPTNLLALKALLSYIGVAADYVQNGLEAVAAVENGAYRLVLMDLMMPGVDGFAATKMIRRREYGTGRHTPIVAVTALDPEFSRDLCIEAGINDFVSKPIDQRTLRKQFARWVTAARRSDEQHGAESEPAHSAQINPAEVRRIYGNGNAEEILESFLGVTDELLKNLSQAIESKDLPAATYFAHEVKGSSLTVYAVEMAQRAFRLEEAIRTENWIEVIKCYSALVADFKRITEDLKVPVKGILQQRAVCR